MAYNKNSKYMRGSDSKGQSAEDKAQETAGKKKTEYRSSVITPRRARELAEAEAKALEEDTASAEEAAEVMPVTPTEEKTPKRTYRSSVITPHTAAQAAEKAETPSEPAQPAVQETVKEIRRGSDADIFKGKADAEKELLYDMESDQITNKERRGNATVRMLASMALLTVITIALQFLILRVPFTQGMFTTEFTAVPELMASIAYGPVFGVIICLIATVVRIIVYPAAAISTLNGFVLNAVFLLLTSLLYRRMMLSRGRRAVKKGRVITRHYSALRLLLCAFIGAIVAMVPQFFLTKYVSYPLLERFQAARFSTENMLAVYRTAGEGITSFLTERFGVSYLTINSITDGILYINLPITFAKLAISSLLTAILLLFTIRFLNYVPKNEPPRD